MIIRVVLCTLLLAVSTYADVLESNDTEVPIALECTVAGIFPVPGNCQKYYECHEMQESGGLYPQISSCPNETNFDNSLNDCRDASLSRLECMYEGSISVQLPDMIKDSESLCRRLESIDRLETTVISTLELRRSLDFAETFNGYIDHYNQNVKEMQTHMGVWRKGDDILSGIRRIYTLAKKYEKEFDRKREIINGRINAIPEKVETKRLSLTEDIEQLKNDIKETRELLISRGAHTRIEQRIATMEERLTNKESKLRNITQVGLELEELVTFLEYVSNDASRIMDLASVSQGRIAELYDNMVSAGDTFGKYAINATRDLENLKTQVKEREAQLQNKKSKILSLQSKKSELDDKDIKLNIELDEQSELNKEIRNSVLEEQVEYAGKKRLMCNYGGPFWFLNAFQRYATSERCDAILKSMNIVYEGKDLEKQLEDSLERMKQISTESEDVHSQYVATDQELDAVRDSMIPIEEKKRELGVEVREFEMFVPDIETLIGDLQSRSSVISDTKEGIQKVESAFRLITEVLDQMIDLAKATGNEIEKQNNQTYIIQDLSTLQELINQSSEDISDIENCSVLS